MATAKATAKRAKKAKPNAKKPAVKQARRRRGNVPEVLEAERVARAKRLARVNAPLVDAESPYAPEPAVFVCDDVNPTTTNPTATGATASYRLDFKPFTQRRIFLPDSAPVSPLAASPDRRAGVGGLKGAILSIGKFFRLLFWGPI